MRASVRRVWFLVVPRVRAAQHRRPLGRARSHQRGARPHRLQARAGRAGRAVAADAPRAHGRRAAAAAPAEGKAGGPFPDIAIVPGGSAVDPPADRGAGIVAWLRRYHERIPTLVSMCTGAFVLGEAGVARRAARDHPPGLPRHACARASLPPASSTKASSFATAASGRRPASPPAIDLALALVEEHHGRGVAMAVAKRLMLYPAPLGQSAPAQPRAAPPGARAAQAIRHLEVRPRARRRAAVRGAHRRRRRHEPAHAQPLVPRTSQRISRRGRSPHSSGRSPAPARGDAPFRSRTSARAPASATRARCGAPSRAASASPPPATGGAIAS